MAELANPSGTIPSELSYIVLAERFGCSPAEVLEWPEQVAEDVALYLSATGADARSRRAFGG